jgi:CRP-like cAMP-binding protein
MNTSLILQHVSRYIQLDKNQAELFISLLQQKIIPRKGFLLRQGDICKTENFIIRGCLRTYSIDEDGVEHIIMFGVEGWWVGDLYSFLTQTPASYFIDALEETEIWQISKPHLDELYDKVPKFERFFRILFQNAFISQQNRINQNLAFTAEQRYLEFLQKYPKLELRLPQRQIAAYLGITPVFLSMLRKKFASK